MSIRKIATRLKRKLLGKIPRNGSNPEKRVDLSVRDYLLESGQSDYPYFHYDNEEAARKALSVVDQYTMCTYQRLITLYQQVTYLDQAKIHGSLVECGTWRGGACGMMALAHMADGEPTRQIHLFDSFEGLPEPDAKQDGFQSVGYAEERTYGNLNPIGRCIGPLEDNRYLMHELVKYPEELTHYHVGWFQQTLPVAVDNLGPIALLRLDGDWYESTKICLKLLYPLVSSGGIVVIDDYGRWEGCHKAVDEFMSTLEQPLLLNHIDGSGRYVIVP